MDTGTAPLSRLLHDLQPVSVYLSCCPGWCWPFHSSPVIISLWAACVGGHWTLDTVTGSGLRSHQPIPSQQTKCQGGLNNHVFYGAFELWAKLRDFCHDICHSVIECSMPVCWQGILNVSHLSNFSPDIPSQIIPSVVFSRCDPGPVSG